jgi:hypothetical protein
LITESQIINAFTKWRGINLLRGATNPKKINEINNLKRAISRRLEERTKQALKPQFAWRRFILAFSLNDHNVLKFQM